MEGMSDIRNDIEKRLGVFARGGAKAEMGLNVSRSLKDEMEYVMGDDGEVTVGEALKELMQDCDDKNHPASEFKKELQDIGIRLGVYKPQTKSQISQVVTNKGKAYSFKRGDVFYIFDSWNPVLAIKSFSRPGAKAKMGILDRISRGLSAATAKPVDPTTPQYASGLSAAKKAAEDAKSNYDYMADLNNARFKQLDNYVKVTSSMIAKMTSTADIQRLIVGLKAAVAARVFVQSSMKTPFSRSQAKIMFASQIEDGNNAFAKQIQNAIDKITKLHFEIANFATDLEASWYANRNKDKGKRYKALVEEAGNLLNQVDDFAGTVIMLGRGRNQSTESMRADAAKAEGALRKLPAFKERLGMIRRAAAKVDAFSRSQAKTMFAYQMSDADKALNTQIRNALSKIIKSWDACENLEKILRYAADDNRKNEKGNQFKALKVEAYWLGDKINDLAVEASQLGQYKGRIKTTEELRAEVAKAQDLLRKLVTLNQKAEMIRSTASKLMKSGAFSRLGKKTEFADGCGSGSGGFKPGNTCGKEGGKAGGGGAKKKPTAPKPSTRRWDVENRVKARQAEERARKRTKRPSGPVELPGFVEDTEELKFNLSELKGKTCADCEAEDTKLGDKIAMATDPAVSKKIGKLMDEGYPQNQAIAIALEMKRKGEI